MIQYPTAAAGVATRVIQGGLEGPVVVLLHGLGARADRWKFNVDALGAAGARALAVDLPGHGFAGKGRGFNYSASGYSAWLEAFIATLNVRRVVLIGTSFGGLVAASYAADFPDRVRGLITVGAIGLVPSGIERRQRTIEWLAQMGRDQIRERLRRGVQDSSLITEELVEEDWRINNSPGAAEAFAGLADYYRHQIDDDAAAVRVGAVGPRFPTRLLWGELDGSVSPEYGAAAQKLIPGSQLEFVPGCGHFPYWERPQVFNNIAIDFTRGCPP
jgi:2-hydroxy-6-oxonona-2,4-dienedioate hydrolase